MLYSFIKYDLNMLRLFYILFIVSFAFTDPPFQWDTDDDGLLDNISSYQYSASITSQIKLDNLDIGSSGDMLAAFVDGELRGIAPELLITFGPNTGSIFFPILIYSDISSGETVTFQFYDTETNLIYNINETYVYRRT